MVGGGEARPLDRDRAAGRRGLGRAGRRPGRRRRGDPGPARPPTPERVAEIERGHRPRRGRVRAGAGRAPGTGRPVGPLRAHLQRRDRHGPGPAAARRRRRPAPAARGAARGREAPGARASRHDLHRAHPRDPRRAHHVRPQDGRLGLRAGPGPRSPAAGPGGGRRGQAQRGGGDLRPGRPPGGGLRLRAPRPAPGRAVHPGRVPRRPRRVLLGAGRDGRDPGADGHRGPPPGPDRGPGGPGAVRRGSEGVLGHAAQAQSHRRPSGSAAWPGWSGRTSRRRWRTWRCGTSGTSPTRASSG